MNVLTIDIESTTSNRGNPYDTTNKLVCISWWRQGRGYAARASPALYEALQKLIDQADVIVGFNFKFDATWLRKVGITVNHKRLFDTQLAEFLISNQQNSYPSLEGCAVKYELGHKLDIIKTEYWDKGIDTDAIPWPILKEYAIQDVALTYQLYLKQLEQLSPIQMRLLNLQNEDQKILQEMEWNGERIDLKLCNTRSQELVHKISSIKGKLSKVYPDVPINWGSNDHVSAFLYGGLVKEDTKEHIGFFKSGAKTGQPKYKNVTVEHQLPRLFTPVKGSELKKEGYYSTTEDCLKTIKGSKTNRKAVDMLLELAKLEKLNGTYYEGLPKLNREMNWKDGYLHGNLNQCVAQTGRLSSSKPNKQNYSSDILDVFVSRF